MRDQDKTKEQLIAELATIRNQLASLEKEESRRKAALRLLTDLPGRLGAHRPSHGSWDWEPHKDINRIAFYPLTQNKDQYTTVEESGTKIVHPMFEGKWEEIVHPDDLDSLKEDLNSILEGKSKDPMFYFRTNRIPNVPKYIRATWCFRTRQEIVGGYSDPTRFMEFVETLRESQELSKSFREERLRDFLFSEDENELVIAAMWDILINQIHQSHPGVINVIRNIALPHYGEIKSERDLLRREVSSKHETIEFFRRAIQYSHDAFFMKSEGKYAFVSHAFANLVGRSESEIYEMTEEQLFGEGSTADFDEIFYDYDMPVWSKLVKTRVGETVNELMIIQMPDEDPNYPHGSSWGLACSLRDIEQEAESNGRLVEYESKAMRAALKRADKAAKSDSIVLLTGETGSGKDYLARYIHDHSDRASGPYFSLNCAAIAPDLAESELFGHEAGAFTGARDRKRGLLELAEGGTLLLNEVGELSLHLQAKLLTFLDTRCFTRVGGEKKVTVSARIVAATNRDLDKEVQAGRFRRDLYYRIKVFPIGVPPLRERAADLHGLAQNILDELIERMQLRIRPQLDSSEKEKMKHYSWPGNVRELRNVLERSLLELNSPDGKLELPIPSSRRHKTDIQSREFKVRFPPEKKLEDLLKDIKQFFVDEALRQTAGNKSEAARLLGASRDLFYDSPKPSAPKKGRFK
jgi:transcriptional regulator with PAS, ATPase and Fis domain